MTSAVDSSILLDVIVDDPKHGATSEDLLRESSGKGPLTICDCVVAEVFPALGSVQKFREFMRDFGLIYVPIDEETSILAGQQFERYLKRGGRSGRIVPDFLIAAHALRHADRLLARDRGYLRDYFKSLRVVGC